MRIKKKEEMDYEAELIRLYGHWDHLREFGGSDPFYDDAVNMNLIRNHIIYTKNKMKELYGANRNQYPEIYFRDLPPETAPGYMARAGEIRDGAKEVLESYLSDLNFQYLLLKRELLDKKEAENTCIDNVLGYVYALAEAVRKDDLITMRGHEKSPNTYREAFASCAEKVKQILSKKMEEPKEQEMQMTLFQIGMGSGQCR